MQNFTAEIFFSAKATAQSYEKVGKQEKLSACTWKTEIGTKLARNRNTAKTWKHFRSKEVAHCTENVCPA